MTNHTKIHSITV